MTPALSIIIPVFNRTEYLGACVESACAQTCEDIEILLVDDYSNEETNAFLQLFASRDPRIRVLHNEGPKGANTCRNLGLRESRGEFVIFLDSDDRLAPFCAERRIADLRTRPDLDFIAYPCLLYRSHPLDRLVIWNVKNGKDLLDRFLAHDAPFQTSGPIWRRRSLVNRLAWEDELPGWQDWVFHVEALLLGLKGELHTRIDYFWNEPKSNSTTRTSHDTAGRARRMASIVRLAKLAPPALRADLLASVIALGVRIRAQAAWTAARLVHRHLRGERQALSAALFVFLERHRLPPLVWLRGFFRKRMHGTYPAVRAITHDSQTYKLVGPPDQIRELTLNLHASRNLS